MLACADARAPVELLFNQGGNAMFVVRVAGNVPGRECLGSLNYAVANLPTVKMITVLGHTSCGAVSAAVDALMSPQVYLDVIHDPSLRAIVDALLAGVRMADQALVDTYGRDVRQQSGFRDALIDLAVTANAAITAVVLASAVDCAVTYGVFSLSNRTVGVTGPTAGSRAAGSARRRSFPDRAAALGSRRRRSVSIGGARDHRRCSVLSDRNAEKGRRRQAYRRQSEPPRQLQQLDGLVPQHPKATAAGDLAA